MGVPAADFGKPGNMRLLSFKSLKSTIVRCSYPGVTKSSNPRVGDIGGVNDWAHPGTPGPELVISSSIESGDAKLNSITRLWSNGVFGADCDPLKGRGDGERKTGTFAASSMVEFGTIVPSTVTISPLGNVIVLVGV